VCGENAVHFLCTPKRRVRGYIAPPKMKVKGYIYPQMEKPVGMLHFQEPAKNFTRSQFFRNETG
jgi:hypothetical protein